MRLIRWCCRGRERFLLLALACLLTVACRLEPDMNLNVECVQLRPAVSIPSLDGPRSVQIALKSLPAN
jgi:hypothetical protein